MRTLLLRSNIFKVSRTVQARKFSSSPQQRFGFDPIEMTALLFRSFHDVSGLTYGIAIPLTTVALRTIVTLPLSIYSQMKLQRRLELRPLFTKWGEVKGMQVVAEQKARNLDLKGNKKAMSEAMSLVRKMVPTIPFQVSK
jgi:membrane protein insertase Oxa1/YidC/SpoIIIJ